MQGKLMPSNKRILHFIESGGLYGAERVILNLSHQLQNNTGYEPVVGCIVDSPESDSDLFNAAKAAGIAAVKVPIPNAKIFTAIPKAAKQLQQMQIDLIHSHGYKPSVFGFLIRLLTGIPIIATCHLWFQPSKGPLKTRVMIRLEKFFYRWFPKIIAVSEPIKDILLASNLPANRVAVIRNGVDIPSPASPEVITRLRQQLGLTENDFCILNSARLSPQKAQWVLIQAAAILKRQGSPAKVIIVGEGPLADELKQQITDENVADCVHLLGFRSDINDLLSLSNVFALPSIDEGMPMSLLEAAAAQKPIISTLVGDIGKLIKHKDTGLVIPTNNPQALAEAVIELKNNPLLTQNIAAQSHAKLIEDYSSQAMCAAYLPVYNQLLNHNH
jgi:glycosyltransferase involved in cell wall biosynthesis